MYGTNYIVALDAVQTSPVRLVTYKPRFEKSGTTFLLLVLKLVPSMPSIVRDGPAKKGGSCQSSIDYAYVSYIGSGNGMYTVGFDDDSISTKT